MSTVTFNNNELILSYKEQTQFCKKINKCPRELIGICSKQLQRFGNIDCEFLYNYTFNYKDEIKKLNKINYYNIRININ